MALSLEVVEVDAPQGFRVGGESDYPGRFVGLRQSVQEEVGKQERCQMVEGEGVLQPVCCDVPGVPVPPDVVDQHVEPGKDADDLLGQLPDLRLGGQISHEHIDCPTVRGLDLSGRVLRAGAVTAADRDVRPHAGQTHGSRPTDAACAPSDQNCAPDHRPSLDLAHVRPSFAVQQPALTTRPVSVWTCTWRGCR